MKPLQKAKPGILELSFDDDESDQDYHQPTAADLEVLQIDSLLSSVLILELIVCIFFLLVSVYSVSCSVFLVLCLAGNLG